MTTDTQRDGDADGTDLPAGPADTLPAAVRPLPVALPPADGETFRSWMDRLAADLRVPLGLLMHRVGVIPQDSHERVPAGYGLALPPTTVSAVAYATGQDAAAVRATLLTSWHGTAADLADVDPDRPDTFRAAAAREWLYATGSHCCPACLHDRDGAWRLAWRLPWSFACTRHAVLLVDTCPGCGQRPQDARRDGRSGPAFASHVPVPGRCDNPAPAGQGLLGRAGQPCSTDLAAADAVWLDHPGVLAAQARLDAVLARSTTTVDGATVPTTEYLGDLRALVSVLLSHATTGQLQAALGVSPSRRRPEWAPDALAAAWGDHDDARRERAGRRAALRTAGADHRLGPRARLHEQAPRSSALMALVCAAAVPALDTGSARALARWAEAAREGNHPGLRALLRDRHASDRLLRLADDAARTTGRFVAAGRIEHDTDRAGHAVLLDRIPALLWPDEWPAFAPLFTGTGTLPDTARRFTSTALVKSLAPFTWTQAGEHLGWPAPSTRTLTANVVNRLNRAGTAQAFHATLTDLAASLRAGDRPLPDLAARRRALAGLVAVPARVLRADGMPVTDARRRNAAVWLWAELTSGSATDAPAWGGTTATPNQKEVYGRFVRRDLPRVEQALREHGTTLTRTN